LPQISILDVAVRFVTFMERRLILSNRLHPVAALERAEGTFFPDD
jgi:hypothetical protein